MSGKELTSEIERACIELLNENKRVVRTRDIRKRVSDDYRGAVNTTIYALAGTGKLDKIEIEGIEETSEGWKYRLSPSKD
ncbi:hypothetical protein [Haloprofundus marisrubri]|uniref:hypothetical protein n=1 Tax=Haloprofundus marisrubri TaxID=1514971 RepID=UPI0012BAF99F|nr:hypothetical protein [Haloprofundus marisrubri]